MIKRNKLKKAFTIVELVIVIAVIAVLAAVLIPTFSGVIDNANDAATLQNARNMYMQYISIDDNIDDLNKNFIIEVKENEKYVVFKDGKIVEEVYSSESEAISSSGFGSNYVLIKEDLSSSENTNPDEPETPTHQHTACPTCGKCTADDCNGADVDKCDCDETPDIIVKDLGKYTFSQQTESITTYLNSNDGQYNGDYSKSYFDTSRGRSMLPNGYTFSNLDESYTNIVIKDNLGSVFYGDEISDGTYTVYNLIPNVEYTCEFTDGTNVLATAKLTATGQVRQIYTTNVPMTEADSSAVRAQNIRDLGGWATTNSNSINYGMLYRSAMLDRLNQEDINILKDILKIGCVIDLRGPATGTANHLGLIDENYIVPTSSANSYTDHLQSLKECEKSIYKKIFNCVDEGIPVLFHCSAGADRTGTYAFMLEALLGVSENNLANDYELTMFSYYDTQTKVNLNPGYAAMVNKLKTLPGTTLEEKAFNWFLNQGFTSEELNNFRAKMTNGTPTEYVQVEYSSLNSTSDSIGLAVKGQDYSFEIKCSDNYEIETINITKNGEEITAFQIENNKITVENLLGDIKIVVSCKKIGTSYTNLCTFLKSGYISGNIDQLSPSKPGYNTYYTNIIKNIANKIGTTIRIQGLGKLDENCLYNRVAVANQDDVEKIRAEGSNLFKTTLTFYKHYEMQYSEENDIYIITQTKLFDDCESCQFQFSFDNPSRGEFGEIIITVNQSIE